MTAAETGGTFSICVTYMCLLKTPDGSTGTCCWKKVFVPVNTDPRDQQDVCVNHRDFPEEVKNTRQRKHLNLRPTGKVVISKTVRHISMGVHAHIDLPRVFLQVLWRLFDVSKWCKWRPFSILRTVNKVRLYLVHLRSHPVNHSQLTISHKTVIDL